MAMFQTPSGLFVVTHAAELAIQDGGHGDVVSPHLHFETEFVMTHLAAEADAVKPVRIDDRPDPFGLGVLIEDDIGVLRRAISSWQKNQQYRQENN